MARDHDSARRVHTRRACRGPVTLQPFGGLDPAVNARLVDLSAGGAGVIADRPLPAGTVVNLTLPGGPGGRRILGSVSHVEAGQKSYLMGIAFGWDTEDRARARRPEPKPGFWARLRSMVPGLG